MGVLTLYSLAEACFDQIEGGDPAAASSIGIYELKISCGQVINQLLRVEHFSVNEKMNEKIPNGTSLGWYEGIAVTTWNGKSKAVLPIKPLKLPRNMGIFSVYPKYTINGNYELDKEYIPLQMGQGGLIKSQPLLNDLLGQVGYENFGTDLIFTKDIKSLFPDVTLAMRLAIFDITLYGDYDVLPLMPEMEWPVINEVVKMYIQQPIPDKVVDSTSKELKGVPLNQQKQS